MASSTATRAGSMRLVIPFRTASHSRKRGREMTGSTIIIIFSQSVYSAPVSDRLSGSRPRTNSVPKIEGSISLQLSAAARKQRAISSADSGRVWSLSKRPPLNHSMRSKPMRPPSFIAPKRLDASFWKSLGVDFAASNMRVNIFDGSRSEPCANMQKTRRLMK
jgi:hypothetical protein